MEEEKVHQESKTQPLLAQTLLPPLETTNINGSQVLPFPVTITPVLVPSQIENPMEKLTLGQVDHANRESAKLIRPIPILPTLNGTTMADQSLNQKSTVDPSPLSLRLSLSSDHNQVSRYSAFQVMSSFNNGDKIISVA